MSLQRTLSWNTLSASLHADRVVVPAGFRTARTLIEGLARIRRTTLVTPTGAYDRTAIMAAAVEAAKAHQRRHGTSWSAAMSVGLAAAWSLAKAARAKATH